MYEYGETKLPSLLLCCMCIQILNKIGNRLFLIPKIIISSSQNSNTILKYEQTNKKIISRSMTNYILIGIYLYMCSY